MDDLHADVAAVAAIDAVPLILDVVCRTTGMGFAAVARVTADRWIACKVLDAIDFGLAEGGELEVAKTICSEIRDCGEPVVIDNVSQSEIYSTHRTPQLYGFQSYISVPIVRGDGQFFGTLCAIDPRPARLDRPEIVAMFRLFAQLIAFHLDSTGRLEASQQALAAARDTAVLREQFIAVLGHDLRGPLAAIDGGMSLLDRRESLSDQGRSIVGMIRASVTRAAGLIDDVLDLARGRLGGGLPVDRAGRVDLAVLLAGVVGEARAGAPGRAIETRFVVPLIVQCDPRRIGQLVANLLGNALTHGLADQPVSLTAHIDGEMLTILVANAGDAIDPAARARLFEPFFREQADTRREGLGLGLYIASEIAKAHGGALTFTSHDGETVFRFAMPVSTR